jgi:hypothetical protein
MDLLSFPVSVHKFEIFYDMGHVWIHDELSLIYLNTKKNFHIAELFTIHDRNLEILL